MLSVQSGMLLRTLAAVVFLSRFVLGQDSGGARRSQDLFASSGEHRFWDRYNLWLFSAIGVVRGLDYASTRNFLARGRTEILLPDDVVNNSAGLSMGHLGVTAFGAARNSALESKHP